MHEERNAYKEIEIHIRSSLRVAEALEDELLKYLLEVVLLSITETQTQNRLHRMSENAALQPI